MAWTTPKTWVPLGTVTAAEMNTYLRDNLNASEAAIAAAAGDTFYATGRGTVQRLPIGGSARVLAGGGSIPAWGTVGATFRKKASAENRVNTTTFANDNDFFFAIGTQEYYRVEMDLFLENPLGGTALPGGFKYQWSLPTGGSARLIHDIRGLVGVPGTGFGTPHGTAYYITEAGTEQHRIGTAYMQSWLHIHGMILNGTVAGTANFQWAQGSAIGTTQLPAYSSMQFERIVIS